MKYIENVVSRANEIELISIDEWVELNNAKAVVLYGTGIMGRSALPHLLGLGLNIVAFSDSNEAKWGRFVDDVLVVPPSQIVERFPDALVIICFNYCYKTEVPKTIEMLQTVGCSKCVFYGDLRIIKEIQALENPLAFGRAILPKPKHQAELCRLYSLLSDSVSKVTLVNVLKDRMSLQEAYEIPSNQIYFPEDIFCLTDDEVFIDCGAYIGDTMMAFIERVTVFKKYYAFEPDKKSANGFCDAVDGLSKSLKDKVHFHTKAVGATCENLRFEETGYAGGSRVAETGNTVVTCTTLDKEFYMSDIKPSIIKMDIEGGEYDALLGAVATIEKGRPLLAISVYHYPNDLWELPLLIYDKFPFYSIFLRVYEAGDIVCYAVPRERVLSRI